MGVNSDRAKAYRERKKGESISLSSSTVGTSVTSNSDRARANVSRRKYGFDTITDDESNVRNSISSAFDSWQDSDYMANTKSSIESMNERLNAYKQYGGLTGDELNNITTISDYYQNALDNWDNLSNFYSNFQNKEAYDKAKWGADNSGLTYEEVQKMLNDSSTDALTKSYLKEYGLISSYKTREDYDKELNALPVERKKSPAEKLEDGDYNTTPYRDKLENARNRFINQNPTDAFKDYSENADFEEKSKYLGSESKTSDYAALNDDLNFWGKILHGDVDSEKEQRLIELSSSEELKNLKANANYIYNTQGEEAFNQYIKDITPYLNKRLYNEKVDAFSESANKNAFNSTLYTAMADIGSVLNLPGVTAEIGLGAINGNYDPYSGSTGSYNMWQDVTGSISSNIADKTEGAEVLGINVPSMAYSSLAVSGVQSKLAGGLGMAVGGLVGGPGGAAVGGKIGSSMLASGAYASTYKDAIERGIDPKNATLTATAAGIAEGLFESLSWDKFIENSSASSIKDIVKNTAKQFFVEGSEEFNTDIANAISDALINGGNSEIAQNKQQYEQMGYTEEEAYKLSTNDFIKQLTESFIGGGLTGGVSSMGTSTRDYRSNTKLGKSVDVGSFSSAIEGLSESEKNLSALTDKYGDNVKNKAAAELGVLYKDALTEADANNSNAYTKAISERLTETGTESNEAESIAKSISKFVSGEKLTFEDKRNIKSEKGQEILSSMTSEDWMEESLKKYGFDKEKISKINDSLTKGMAEKIAENVKNNNATKEVDLATVTDVTTDGEKLTLVTDEGKVNASDVKLSNDQVKMLSYASLKSSQVAKEAYIENYKGQNIEAYDSAFNLVYDYGYNQRNMDSLYEKVSSVFSESDMTKIYKSALDSRIGANKTLMESTNKLIDKWSKDVKSGSFDDSSLGEKGYKGLDSTQRRLYVFAKAWTTLGANVRVINDASNESENGHYDREKNEITINLSARYSVTSKDTALFSDPGFVVSTTAHELTHFMEEQARGTFDSLKMALQKYYNSMSDSSWDYMVEKQKSSYEKNYGAKLSTLDAESEVVARACEDMLNNPDTMTKIVSNMSIDEAKSFKQTIRKVFDKVIEFINNLMKNYNSSSMEAFYLRKSKTAFEEVRNLWIDGISEALKTNQFIMENAMDDVLNGTGKNLLFNDDLYTEKELIEARNTLDYSLKNNDTLIDNAIEMNRVTHQVDERVLTMAKALMDKTATALKKVEQYLPEDIEGEVIVGNASYSKSAEHALVCVRSLVNNWFIDEISENVGRPLTVLEQITASEVLASYVGNDRECQYCYVATDRKEYRATFLKYQAMYDSNFKRVQKNMERTQKEMDYIEEHYDEIFKNLSNKNTRKDYIESHKNKLPGFYTFLNKRSASTNMLERYVQFSKDALEDKYMVDLADYTTDKKMDQLLKDETKSWYISDAIAYAKGAAQPKSKSRTFKTSDGEITLDYVAYNGSVLKMTQAAVDALNSEYGLRVYSYSDYTPAFLLEDMQIVMDASVRGLKMLAYTKDPGFIKVFAPTGMGINASTYGKMDEAYKNDPLLDEAREKYRHRKTDANRKAYLDIVEKYVLEDDMQGVVWDKIKALRKEFSNVGAVFVATNDDLVEWSMAQDWIDVVIPYHLVRAGKDLAKFYDFKDYKKNQADRKKKVWKATNEERKANGEEELLKSIPPTLHGNDKEKYFKALADNKLNPRFEDYVTNPNYMKLVNETRMAYTDMSPVKPMFGEMEELQSDEDMTFEDTSIQKELDRIPLEGAYGLLKGAKSIEEQRRLLENALKEARKKIVYSDKAEVNELYRLADENQRITKENEILKDDVDRLSEIIALNKKKTLGKVFSPDDISSVADYLLKKTNSTYNKTALRHDLTKAYMEIEEYIGNKTEAAAELSDWEYVLYKCQNVAQSILSGVDTSKTTFNTDSKNSTLANDMVNQIAYTDMVRELSKDIYNKMWTVSKFKSSADIMQEDAKRLLLAHNNQMAEITKIAELSAEKKYRNIIKNLENETEKKVNEVKQFTRENQKRIEDAAQRKDEMDKLVNMAMRLTKKLRENPKGNTVPKMFREPLANLLTSISFSSKQLERTYGVKTTKNELGEKVVRENVVTLAQALESIQEIANKHKTETAIEDGISDLDLPPNFYDQVDKLYKEVNAIERSLNFDSKFVLAEMSTEQIQTLRNTLEIISSAITQTNKILSQANAHGVDFYAKQDLESAIKLPQKKSSGAIREAVKNIYTWGQTLPYYAFKRMGKGASYIFSLFQDGLDVYTDLVTQTIAKTEELYTKEDINKWEKEVHEFTVYASEGAEPRNIKITKAQMMSLYCLSKREQAVGHIFGGGIRIAKFTDTENKKKEVDQKYSINMTKSSFDQIIEEFKKDEKAVSVAEELQNYMSTECASWGNYITMKRWGIEGYGEKNYFPITVVSDALKAGQAERGKTSLYALLNMSFTKKLQDNASNPIMVDDIFDVFAKHTSDMARYRAYALPVLDLLRYYNYKEISPTGESRGYEDLNLKTVLTNAYGDGLNSYVMNFISDINGVKNKGRLDMLSSLMKPFKTAAVGFNMVTALLQPLSYIRARYVMDSKYLYKGASNPAKIKKAIEKMNTYCGIAKWKSLGFFEMDVTTPVEKLIKHDKTWKERAVEFSLKGAELGDTVTWGAIWLACEAEISDKTDLEYNSVEYNKAVALRMRDIVYSTQVVDSPLTRSQNMRATDVYSKMETAFLSEPTVSYNMLMENVSNIEIDARTMGLNAALAKNRKQFSRSIVTYLLGVTVESVLRSCASKLRGSADEDEEFYNIFFDEFKDQANPVNMLPVIKDFWSIIFTNYGTTRMDEDVINQVKKLLNSTKKIVNGDDELSYKYLYQLIRTASQTTGIAGSNALRELETLWNNTVGRANPEYKLKH